MKGGRRGGGQVSLFFGDVRPVCVNNEQCDERAVTNIPGKHGGGERGWGREQELNNDSSQARTERPRVAQFKVRRTGPQSLSVLSVPNTKGHTHSS